MINYRGMQPIWALQNHSFTLLIQHHHPIRATPIRDATVTTLAKQITRPPRWAKQTAAINIDSTRRLADMSARENRNAMSSTLLFCDRSCHGLRTLYDCCYVFEASLYTTMLVQIAGIIPHGMPIACFAGHVAL
jgi:hypothetical protein